MLHNNFHNIHSTSACYHKSRDNTRHNYSICTLDSHSSNRNIDEAYSKRLRTFHNNIFRLWTRSLAHSDNSIVPSFQDQNDDTPLHDDQ